MTVGWYFAVGATLWVVTIPWFERMVRRDFGDNRTEYAVHLAAGIIGLIAVIPTWPVAVLFVVSWWCAAKWWDRKLRRTEGPHARS